MKKRKSLSKMNGIDIPKASVDTKLQRASISLDSQLTCSIEDACPVCGTYVYDGNVCIACQKKYGIYEPKCVEL